MTRHLLHSWLAAMWRAGLCCAVLIVALSRLGHAQTESGTWRGTVNQPGVGDFPVTMQLDGRGGGTTEYPTLHCSGVLSGGPGVYQERIVSNRAGPDQDEGCIDGKITISISGDRMNWSWAGTFDGENYTASGVLTRAAK